MASDQITENHHIPFFSIIVLLWNSNAYIARCLNALSDQIYRDFEVILVDNGSPEPFSLEILDQFKNLNIKFHRSENNSGYAEGNNVGAGLASGRFLAVLNSDAFPKPDWLSKVFQATAIYPYSFFASKLIMADFPERLDGEGDIYHISGLVWRKSYNMLASKMRTSEGQVFSACGAAAIYPRDVFTAVGGFDPDYFAYIEDIDLGFRLRLAGYKCVYLPDAGVFHVGSGSTGYQSRFSVYYGQRNLVWTFFKDMPTLLLITLLPFHILMNLVLILSGISRGRGLIVAKAKIDAIKGLPVILKKRKLIQRQRKASIIELLAVMNINPFSPLQLYFQKRDPKPVNRAK